MRVQWIAVALVASALISPLKARGDDFNDAVSAYDRGDYVTALRVFRKYAEQGDVDAQHNLAAMYDNGEGVQQNYGEAVRWYRLSAGQGDADAQTRLGVMYATGEGVSKDYREAARWTRLAAEQGDAVAQTNLGKLYSDGTGVLQDFQEALRWHRKAAAQGYATGMANLGAMYGNGRGVPRNYVRAHMWANLAAAAGGADFAAANRDINASQMTLAQIAEAQRLARECLASNYQRCGEPGEQPATPPAGGRGQRNE